MHYLTRQAAAELLTVRGLPTTPQALADAASDGTGPRYGLVRGRALYTAADLDSWLATQLARPIIRRRQQTAPSAAAS